MRSLCTATRARPRTAYAKKTLVTVDGLEVPVISVEDLIANKRASGRTQDLADVEKLESLFASTGAPHRDDK
jgi:predicted nucleotidyltransferase